MAEYTNGNFLSRGTIFRDFDLPRPTSLEPTPFAEAEGARFRTYFSKVTEGEAVPHFVAVGALQRKLREALQVDRDEVPAGGWVLEDRVHRDYAARLIPRAVGFSAALLDYFFRGRLDVDLFADPDDPTLVRVRGTNASDEALRAGTLRFYADDPAGVRTPLPPASPTADLTVTAAPGAPVVSAPFRMTPNAERVVAVYQGTLGEEKPDPAGTFPGAVIGKVLGGVRVEELFGEPDTEETAGRWKLRTPKGVYDLVDEAGRPLTVERFEVVKFGDDRDLLVARTPFGASDNPDLNRVIAYRIPRPANAVPPPSSSVDPVTDEMGIVHLEKVTEAELPPAIPLPPLTRVEFRWHEIYQQQVMRVTGKVTKSWHDDCGGIRCIAIDAVEYDSPTFDSLTRQNVDFTVTFDVVLDRSHGIPFPEANWGANNYLWDLADVTVDGRGHLLALVYALLTVPKGPPPRVLSYYIDTTGAEATPNVYGYREVIVDFPREVPSPLLWALVDLTDGRLLASTAGPVVTLTMRRTEPQGDQPTAYWPDGKSGYLLKMDEGGPEGDKPGKWKFARFLFEARDPITATVSLPSQSSGYGLVALTGVYPPSLEVALRGAGVSTGYTVVTAPAGPSTLVYACSSSPPLKGCAALTWTSTYDTILQWPTGFIDARRRAPATAAGQLVFIADNRVFTWDPAEDATRGRAEFRYRAYGDFAYFADVTSSTALVRSGRFLDWDNIEYSSALVPLEGAQAPREYPGVNLGDSFVLLDPGYLYSATELKFFTTTPTPEKTVLPATLAPVPGGNPLGYYHAIRVP